MVPSKEVFVGRLQSEKKWPKEIHGITNRPQQSQWPCGVNSGVYRQPWSRTVIILCCRDNWVPLGEKQLSFSEYSKLTELGRKPRLYRQFWKSTVVHTDACHSCISQMEFIFSVRLTWLKSFTVFWLPFPSFPYRFDYRTISQASCPYFHPCQCLLLTDSSLDHGYSSYWIFTPHAWLCP